MRRTPTPPAPEPVLVPPPRREVVTLEVERDVGKAGSALVVVRLGSLAVIHLTPERARRLAVKLTRAAREETP